MNIEMLRLGKAPATEDDRTIKMASILRKTMPPPPLTYNFDAEHPGCLVPMHENDKHGDCVMVARAHMTTRLELIEQSQVIPITDADVLREYFKESGGADSGLNMLQSLKAWRLGWTAARRKYSIHAFASVRPANKMQVAQAIYIMHGCYSGVMLPKSAQSQLGKLWTITRGRDAAAGSWGGHCMAICGYNIVGPIFMTWGAKQQATWAWFAAYCDEAYGIVDNADAWLTKATIDVEKLEAQLKEIAA